MIATALNYLSTNEPARDELWQFMSYLHTVLKNLPPHLQLELKHKIQKAMYEVEKQDLDKTDKKITNDKDVVPDQWSCNYNINTNTNESSQWTKQILINVCNKMKMQKLELTTEARTKKWARLKTVPKMKPKHSHKSIHQLTQFTWLQSKSYLLQSHIHSLYVYLTDASQSIQLEIIYWN